MNIQLSSTSPQKPSIVQMAANLTSTMYNVVSAAAVSGQILANENTANDRLKVCFGCEFYIHEQQRCSKCGCFMVAKVKLQAAKCPVNKW